MKTRAIVVCVLVLFAVSTAFAGKPAGPGIGIEKIDEEITIPDVKLGKVIEDEWYHLFVEGQKVCFANMKLTEGEVDGVACYVVQTDKLFQVKLKGKDVRRVEKATCIIGRSDFKPMYQETKTSAPDFEFEGVAKVEAIKGGHKVTYTKTLNGKTVKKEKEVWGDDFYFAETSLVQYRKKFFKEDMTVNVFDWDINDAIPMQLIYAGRESEGDGEEARTLHKIQEPAGYYWLDDEGRLVKDSIGEGLGEGFVTDRKTAKDFSVEYDDYTAPDFLKGDILTAGGIGIKMKRPGKTYYFVPGFENNLVVAGDLIAQSGLLAVSFFGVPGGTKHEAVIDRIKELFAMQPSTAVYELGEGRMTKSGEEKCLRGSLAMGTDIDADRGEYHLFIFDDRIIFFMAFAKGDGYADAKKELTKSVDSIKFFEPEFDEDELLYVDEKTGLRFNLPNPGWMAYPVSGRPTATCQIYHVWTMSSGSVEIVTGAAQLTPEILIATMAQREKLLDSGTMKVGDCGAAFIEYEKVSSGISVMMKQVMIIRNDKLIIVTLGVRKSNWESLEGDVEKMIESLDFVQEREEESDEEGEESDADLEEKFHEEFEREFEEEFGEKFDEE